jgi:UDP-N-acetylmuramoylalanine--D-glutamate ligase
MDIKKLRKKHIQNFLKSKKIKIVIWGFGLTGKSLLKWCLDHLPKENEYIVIDKEAKDLSEYSFNFIVSFQNEEKVNSAFYEADFILLSPGIKIDKITFIWYHKIIPELDLFYFLINQKKIKSILITGSIGKSSLTTIIEQNIAQYKKTILCGNIGFPVMNFVNSNLNGKEIFCIEASDAQLKHSVLIAPTIFLITNIFKNHLNFHKTFQDYIKAKLTPIKFQINKIKNIILTDQAFNEIKKYIHLKDQEKIFTIVKTDIINYQRTLVKKPFTYIYSNNQQCFLHNKVILSKIPNISFATNWLMTLGVIRFFFKQEKNDLIKKIMTSINLPNHRLKKIFNSEKIDIFNDSKSTIMESTQSGLQQLKTIYPAHTMFFVLIGGLSKGVDRTKAILKIKNQERVKIAIFGKEMNIFKEKFANEENIMYEEEIKKCLEKIFEATKFFEKNVILFSPGGSSFDQFSSFEKRGNYFSELVKNIFIEKNN